jgi:hypothetical protein
MFFFVFFVFYVSYVKLLILTSNKMKIFTFFFTCPHKRRGGEIRTSDLRFMRRGPQPIELPHEDLHLFLFKLTIQIVMLSEL